LIIAFLGIPLVFCGGIAVWWFGRNAVAQQELDRRVAELQTRGLPVDNQSLAAYHEQLTDDLNTAQWIQVIGVLSGEEFRNQVASLPILGSGNPPPSDLSVPWPEKAAVENVLSDYADTLAQIHRLAESDKPVRYPIKFESFDTLLENTQATRTVARLLQLEHEVALRNGDAASQYQTISSMLGLSASLRGEPLVVSNLVSIALHGVAISALQKSLVSGQLEDDQLQRLAERMEQFGDYQETTKAALAGERAMALPIFADPGGMRAPDALGVLGSRSIDALYYLTLLEDLEETISADPNSALQAGQQFETAFAARTHWLEKMDSMMTSLVAPALSTYLNAVVRGVLLNRLALLAIEVQRYKNRHGTFPASIDQLAEDGVDIDALVALDGKPFGYSAADQQAILWGYNLADQPQLTPLQGVPDAPPQATSGAANAEVIAPWIWQLK
jgi:hypothetical protein